MTRTKEQNSSSTGFNPDYSLPRSKILRGKRNFQRLFERSTVLRKPSILCRSRIYKNRNEKCLFGFIAPKRTFRRAVDRNRVKRWLRESFRLNQYLLPHSIREQKIGFHAVFIATSATLTYAEVEKQMISLLQSISDRMTASFQSEKDNIPKK